MLADWFSRSSVARLWALVFWLMCGPVRAEEANEAIRFNRDIRPILSDNCFQCHGPDQNKRQADLRLDVKQGLFDDLPSGAKAIVPGQPAESELLRRIQSTDPSQMMPAPESGKKLQPREIALIQRWIEQGAAWQGHWAYLAPVRQPPPPRAANKFVRNDIDRFILASLQKERLQPAPAADPVTLLRRLSFDLTGLPPTSGEVESFQQSVIRNPQSAIDAVVDRLLASPHFGERMAIYWLDLVRFADTIGYHSDNPRDIAPYRDWVIAAFNDNLPFDRFTIEQLAGDLLPNPNREQLVASGYNRLIQTTEEGGAQAKEYVVKYAADRVRNVSSVWLGATMGCAECHDHKFDPYTQRDFYSLAAFFADVKETAVGRREPGMLLSSPEQAAELKHLDSAIAAVKKTLDTTTPQLAAAQAQWEAEQKTAPPANGKKLPKPIAEILALEADKRSEAHNKALAAHYRTMAPPLESARKELAGLDQRRAALVDVIPRSLITMTDAPRTTRILPRGNWLDETGPIVQPAAPRSLAARSVVDRRATRLDLAQWIVSPDNPLTARVFVNRLWKLCFGQGLSRTLDDLGSQGEWPAQPELLDWLAVEFQESGWDIKHLLRLLVTSGTYQQSAHGNPQSLQQDPDNRLFARQTSFRLDAEMVRDNALAISGLLSPHVGGESVKPYQPDGYWDYLNFPKRTYQHDVGELLYRRSLYTHWQRSFLHPMLLAFDAPSREECVCERPRSNTPQQALVLLNDPEFVEAARVFAEHIVRDGGRDDDHRLEWAFRRALSRTPNGEEAGVLRELLAKHRAQYTDDKAAAEKLASVGESPRATQLDVADVAAWASVARALLNLHETMTRY